tara:strand:- start:241 stop:651 length:411 start_codon:yes stop_codon:yes gene_type:complete
MADTIDHNIRVAQLVTGESIICNFTQVREEEKFVGYQVLYPLSLTLNPGEPDANGEETFSVTYRRWNPFTPYEDHRINPSSVISAMPPSEDILVNYVARLKQAGVDLSFLPNNGADILGETTQSATTEGPVAAGVS